MNKTMKKLAAGLLALLLVPVAAMLASATNIALSSQQVIRGGLAATYTGSLLASNVYQVSNDGRVILHFKKTQATACTVTFTAQETVLGIALSNPTVSVPGSTGDVFVGPFPASVFNDTSGYLNFSLSEESGLTVAVLHL